MFVENFKLKYLDEDLDGIISKISEEPENGFPLTNYRLIQEAIEGYLGKKGVRAFILEDNTGRKAGFILFNSWRILYLFLHSSITGRKIPGFMLTEAAFNKMKEDGSRFIASWFPRLRKTAGSDDLSSSPPLLGFFYIMGLTLHLKLSEIKSRYPGSRVPDHISCYSLSDEKHITPIINLYCNEPDPFIQKLLPSPDFEKEREQYYRETLFLDEYGKKMNYSPDYSTVVYDESGRCIACLLSDDIGYIKNIKISHKTGMDSSQLITALLNRMIKNLDYKKIRLLKTDCYEDDRRMMKWLKKFGFKEYDEYPVWGWNEDM